MGFRAAFLVLLLVLVGLVATVFQDFGISSDEAQRNRYGKAVWDYYTSGLANTKCQRMGAISYYGGIFDTVAAAVVPHLPYEEFDARHLLGGLVGILGIIGVFCLGSLLAGPGAGFFSALLLGLIPGYSGAMFFNPKDVPFAVAYVWSLYFLLKGLRSYSTPCLSSALWFGFSLGCLLALKVVGVIFGAAVGVGYLYCFFQGQFDIRSRIQHALRFSIVFLLPACALAYFIMLLFWPWAQLAPIANPLKALNVFSVYPHWRKYVLLFGESYAWNKVPASYVPTYLLVQLPELVLIALFGWLIWTTSMISRTRTQLLANFGLPYAVLLTAALFPPLMAIIKGSTIYSGYRHFLFIVPVLATFGGLFLDHLWQRLRASKPFLLPAYSLFLLASVIYYAIQFTQLHPYQYTYFNRLVGGLKGASGQFETDYWALTYREAVAMLGKHVKELRERGNEKPIYRVAICGSKMPAVKFFPKSFRLTSIPRADFVIAPRHRKCEEVSGTLIGTISRQGAELTVIKANTAKDMKLAPMVDEGETLEEDESEG